MTQHTAATYALCSQCRGEGIRAHLDENTRHAHEIGRWWWLEERGGGRQLIGQCCECAGTGVIEVPECLRVA